MVKQSTNVIGTVWGIGPDGDKIQIELTQNDGHVFLCFNRDVAWVGMTPDAAKFLAFAMLEEVFGAREEEKDRIADMQAAQVLQPLVAEDSAGLVDLMEEKKEV